MDVQCITKEFISITTFTCQFCHSGLSRILLFSERFPTSGNDRRGFTYGLISNRAGCNSCPYLRDLLLLLTFSLIFLVKIYIILSYVLKGGKGQILPKNIYLQYLCNKKLLEKAILKIGGSKLFVGEIPTKKSDIC